MHNTVMARIRAVVLEENAHLQLSSNLCEGEGIGVLVGRVRTICIEYIPLAPFIEVVFQITSKSCYVLRFVPTPAPAASPVPSREWYTTFCMIQYCNKNIVGSSSLFPFEDWWVEDHAHQVGVHFIIVNTM